MLCKRRSLFTMSEFIRRNFVVHSKSFWMCAMLKQKYKHNLLDLSPRLIAMHNVCPISGLYTDQSECERFIILSTFCHESLRFFDNFFRYILFFSPEWKRCISVDKIGENRLCQSLCTAFSMTHTHTQYTTHMAKQPLWGLLLAYTTHWKFLFEVKIGLAKLL